MPKEMGKVYLQWWVNAAGICTQRTAHLSLEDAIKFRDDIKGNWRLRPGKTIWSQPTSKKNLKQLKRLLRGRTGALVTNKQVPWGTRTDEAHTIYYRYWYAKGGKAFSTLHVSREMAEGFLKKKSGEWKSTPSENLYSRIIPQAQFIKICDAIGDGSGVKAWPGDFE